MVSMPSAENYARIMNLYGRYSWAMDTGDLEAMQSLFTKDAIFRHDEGAFETNAGIAKGMIDVHFAVDVGVQHHVANMVIEGNDQSCVITSQCFGLDFAQARNESKVRYVGYYIDKLVNENGEWFFDRRWYSEWKGEITKEGRDFFAKIKKEVVR